MTGVRAFRSAVSSGRARTRRAMASRRPASSSPPSWIATSARWRAASTNCDVVQGHQGLQRACSSVRGRRRTLAGRRVEDLHRRRRGRALPEGVEAAPVVRLAAVGHVDLACCSPPSPRPPRRRRGWYGFTLGPPIFVDQQPAGRQGVDRGPSRASIRKRGPRESRRLSASFSSFSGVAAADWRYVADVTMSRKSAFTSQPDSRNSTASQSSSFGCDGSSPVMPKSPAVGTRPVPKTSCQKRLTVTRAVSGWSGWVSHCASPRRLAGAPWATAGGPPGRAAGDLVSLLVVLAADENVRERFLGPSSPRR